MYTQFHKEFSVGMFRISFYKIRNKWCLRFEINSGNWS